MCKFQEETRHGKGFGFSLEEVIVGGVGDHCGLAVLFDAHLKERVGLFGGSVTAKKVVDGFDLMIKIPRSKITGLEL